MDIEKIIDFVRARFFLYNVKDPEHKNCTMVINAWKSLGEDLGCHGKVWCSGVILFERSSSCATVKKLVKGAKTK